MIERSSRRGAVRSRVVGSAAVLAVAVVLGATGCGRDVVTATSDTRPPDVSVLSDTAEQSTTTEPSPPVPEEGCRQLARWWSTVTTTGAGSELAALAWADLEGAMTTATTPEALHAVQRLRVANAGRAMADEANRLRLDTRLNEQVAANTRALAEWQERATAAVLAGEPMPDPPQSDLTLPASPAEATSPELMDAMAEQMDALYEFQELCR